MSRITSKMLDTLASRLNPAMKRPMEPRTMRPEGGTLRANVGNFHIYAGYRCYSLHEMNNESGGVISHYSGSAAEMYGYLRGMLDEIRRRNESAPLAINATMAA